MKNMQHQKYRARDSSWKELADKVYNLSRDFSAIGMQGADFSRSLDLEESYANISVYGERRFIDVFYFGINECFGKLALENRLGLKLRRVPLLTGALTRKDMKKIEEADKARTPSPSEI